MLLRITVLVMTLLIVMVTPVRWCRWWWWCRRWWCCRCEREWFGHLRTVGPTPSPRGYLWWGFSHL